MSETTRERYLSSIFGDRRHGMTEGEKNAVIEALSWLQDEYGITFSTGGCRRQIVSFNMPLVVRRINGVIEVLRNAIPELFGVSFDSLFNEGCRKREYVLIRDCCYETMVRVACCSEMKVAEAFGKNHSTVLHARSALKDWLEVGDAVAVRTFNMIYDTVAGRVDDVLAKNKPGPVEPS